MMKNYLVLFFGAFLAVGVFWAVQKNGNCACDDNQLTTNCDYEGNICVARTKTDSGLQYEVTHRAHTCRLPIYAAAALPVPHRVRLDAMRKDVGKKYADPVNQSHCRNQY